MHPRVLAFVVALVVAASVISLPADAGPEEFGVSAVWGQAITSQLVAEDAVSYWSLRLHAPLVEAMGLEAGMRIDSIVFGARDNALSMAVHPGRTEYNLTLRLVPASLPLGVELHHVSSHAVAPLHDGSAASFEDQIAQGGASNLLSLVRSDRWGAVRVGVGSVWADTNTGPILLGLDTFLLNSRSARGPMAAARFNIPAPGRLRMSAGALVVQDSSHWHEAPQHLATWGLALRHSVYERMSVGISYAGNNGTPGIKRGDNAVSAVLHFAWGVR